LTAVCTFCAKRPEVCGKTQVAQKCQCPGGGSK